MTTNILLNVEQHTAKLMYSYKNYIFQEGTKKSKTLSYTIEKTQLQSQYILTNVHLNSEE